MIPLNATVEVQNGNHGSTFSPAELWSAAVAALEKQLPRVDVETWVKTAFFKRSDQDTWVIGCANSFGKDWLEKNASPLLEPILSEIIKRPVMIRYEVCSLDDLSTPTRDAVLEMPSEMVAMRNQLLKPERVIRLPIYLLRWLPYVGARVVFITAALWQEHYLASGGRKHEGDALVSTRVEQICRWAGVSRAQFFRLTQPGSRLEWLAVKQQTGWTREGKEGGVRKRANRYKLFDAPLTPGDAQDLRLYLSAQGIKENPQAALKKALAAPIEEIWPHPRLSLSEFCQMNPHHQSVQGVVKNLLGDELSSELAGLADKLAVNLQRQGEFIPVSWYFLTNWLPRLGPDASMFVLLLRSMCYFNDESGEERNIVWMKGGYGEIAERLGLSNPREAASWFPAVFSRGARKEQLTAASQVETLRRGALRENIGSFIKRVDWTTNRDGSCSWKFQVQRQDPLTTEDQQVLDEAGELVGRAHEAGVLEELREWTQGFSDGNLETSRLDLRQQEPVKGCSDTLARVLKGCFERDNAPAKDRFETVLKILKTLKDTCRDQETNHQDPWNTKKGGGDPQWSLEAIVKIAGRKNQEMLLAQEDTALPFLSWLIYGSSQENITDPCGLAIARLKENPGRGAGGASARLAAKPSRELIRLIRAAAGLSSPVDPDWRILFEQVSHARIRLLADLLGIDTGLDPDRVHHSRKKR